MDKKQRRVCLFLIVFLKLLNSFTHVSADLSLFDEQNKMLEERYEAEFQNNLQDKLHLFPNQKKSLQEFCSEMCSAKQGDSSSQQETKSDLIKKNSDADSNQKIPLNAGGVVRYYQDFVFSFLSDLNLIDLLPDDTSSLDVNLKFTLHDLIKLKKFAKHSNDSEALLQTQDVTDILKQMVNYVKFPSAEDSTAEAFNFRNLFDRLDSNDAMLRYAAIFLFSVLLGYFVTAVVFTKSKRGFLLNHDKFSWRSSVVFAFFVMFAISIVNNHNYLTQKKQILKQQKIKEMVPEECLLDAQQQQNNMQKNEFSRFVDKVFNFMGRRATSRRCLEYQEALFITTHHNNYLETIVYTITEGFRPMAVSFGEFINNFYSALTKDLSFYQYMPLIALVTAVLVPVTVFMLSLLSLIMFNYEFNFFHLISFRKNTTVNDNKSEAIIKKLKEEKTEFLRILNEITKQNDRSTHDLELFIEDMQSKETSQLNTNSIQPQQQQQQELIQSIQEALEDTKKMEHEQILKYSKYLEETENDENINQMIKENFRSLLKKLSFKEILLNKKIDDLKERNSKLSTILNQYSIELKPDMERSTAIIECLPNNDLITQQQMASRNEQENISSSKVVSIGLSKTIVRSPSSNVERLFADCGNRVVKLTESMKSSEDDDEEEDIYVILDEH